MPLWHQLAHATVSQVAQFLCEEYTIKKNMTGDVTTPSFGGHHTKNGLGGRGLRGYCTSNLKLACFCSISKKIPHFFEKK